MSSSDSLAGTTTVSRPPYIRTRHRRNGMNWANVKLIFHRELRDQLRDRRTLFMIVVLPLLLYPSIGIGLVQFTVLFAEQPRQVAVRGSEHLPPFPALIAPVPAAEPSDG